MGIETQIQLFDNAKIRVAWDDEKEKYFFSVVDVLHVLTDSANHQTYWRVLKKRLLDKGNETVTNCNALKLPSTDGKMRLTDVADLEGILRIVQCGEGSTIAIGNNYWRKCGNLYQSK